ncbi:T9SS type A sorting domain-containing protein [Carboxylicivirga mesophila]|uniref:T9SS type A sorting domain-containing protein n=1 Tax=Carboxylicivirga mesophila TaxID=1166478 RepID=A0ABS5K8T2_9BACT|nr:GDSL-type esterase/lipase family protein [Carboxylicivirga mesophila]MBS2211400.1 T9SS type A sorting domain-containing protein [Carboxylicivirga mesophila]
MKKIQILICLLLGFMPLLAQTTNISPDNPLIQYAGRMDFSKPGAPTFSIPSSSILVKFNGTALSARFTSSGTSYLYVIIDGQADPFNRQIIELSGRNVSYLIAENLSAGEHTVQLVKLNEYDTQITFWGLEIADGNLLEPPARAPLKIEFYGDSNPSGWSAWDVRDEGHANLSGSYFTYPGLTARMLNAEYSNFSAGGHGVTDLTRKLDMKDLYNRIHIAGGAKASNIWDFQNNYWQFTPDVVVINLGANDYYAGASKELMMSSWNQFVSALRTHYPDAHIVMANSYGWAFNEPADYVDEFVQSRMAGGDTNISFVKFPWLWSDYHAVINEHAGFADILATHIADVLDLPPPTLSTLSSFGQNSDVGNGSFESSVVAGYADGWRPFASWSYPELITDAAGAYDGERYLGCTNPSGVMHANDAQPGDVFEIKVWMKATAGSVGRLKYEFRGQGQNIISLDQVDVTAAGSWEQISITTHPAPSDTWQINVILEGVDGTIYFDKAEMQKVANTTMLKVSTSISNSLSKEETYSIYPNPATSVLTIQTPGTTAPQYSIYNTNGLKCQSGFGNKVNIEKLAKGLYFIIIKGASHPIKFVKQ